MTWRTGTPPADKPGWYQASSMRVPDCWRWWNGSVFSRACYADQRVESVWRDAQLPHPSMPGIEWLPQPEWYRRWLIKRGLPTGVTQ